MQKLCCVRTIQQPLRVWIIVTSLPTHISIKSHPYLAGIASHMKSLMLSTTEAEYVAVSEVVKDQVFVPNPKEHGNQGTTSSQGSSGQCKYNMVGK